MGNHMDKELETLATETPPAGATPGTEGEFERAFDNLSQGRDAVPYDALSAIGNTLLSEFSNEERMRQNQELRWLKDLRQYKGIYSEDVSRELEEAGRSKIYKRMTAQKVDIATSTMLDLLFPTSDKNYSVDPSPKPTLPPFKMQQIHDALAQAANGQALPEDVIRSAVYQAAQKAAKAMEAQIDDQLQESRYRREVKRALFSGHLYGTGVLKGALTDAKTSVSYEYDTAKKCYVTKVKKYAQPTCNHVSLWRFYPDSEANEIEHCRYVWEHHRLTESAMLKMAGIPGFNKQAIVDFVKTNPQGRTDLRTYESEFRSIGDQQQTSASLNNGLYDTFERYGWLRASDLASAGVHVPDDRMDEVVFANVWLLPDGTVIRMQLLRDGMTYPYHLYQFREDESSIFADGIATIMRDDQDAANASLRATMDNAAASAGPQGVANTQQLAQTEDLKTIRPWKIWLQTKGDSQYPPISFFNVPSNTEGLLQLTNYFEASADDTTMLPRYMSGDNPTQGAAQTMGGLSMLIGQSKIAIKSLVLNFDEGITRPVITSLVAWNMLYNPDDDIKGDFSVMARGVSTIVAKEVRANQAQQFNAAVPPEARKYLKPIRLLREIAAAHEFDDVVMTDEEAQQVDKNPNQEQAMQMQMMQGQLQLALLKAKVAESEASAVKTQMDALLTQAKAAESSAKAMETKVTALYEAIQAGGIVVTNPHIAAAADEIARNAGWNDQAAQPTQPAVQNQQPQPQAAQPQPDQAQLPQTSAPQPPAPPTGAPQNPMQAQGVQAGIETPALGNQ